MAPSVYASMVRGSQFALILLLMAALSISPFGCVSSEQPLVSEEESVIDADLLGTWRCEFEGDETYVLTIQPMPGSETIVEAVDDDELLELRLTTIGEGRYVCLRWSDGRAPYLIARYELQGKELRFYELETAAIANAIHKGEIGGRTPLLFWRSAEFTANPTEIRAYLEKHGNDCFERSTEFVLTRIDRKAEIERAAARLNVCLEREAQMNPQRDDSVPLWIKKQVRDDAKAAEKRLKDLRGY